MKVFVTGASGCVGHYVVEALSRREDVQLYLLMRSPKKFQLERGPRMTIVEGSIEGIAAHADLVAEMDVIVHLAAAWGEQAAYDVNHRGAIALFGMGGATCRIINFSTASILGPDNTPLDIALSEGTDYIRSKYLCHADLPSLPQYDRIVTVFPTLILGGSPSHPYSHLAGGLAQARRWAGLVRFLTVDGSLHFIHARDIATVVERLVDGVPSERELVLGQPGLSADSLINRLSAFYGKSSALKLDLTPLLSAIAVLFKSKMNSWDHVCMRQRHFRYQVTAPEAFGMPSAYPTIETVLQEYAPA